MDGQRVSACCPKARRRFLIALSLWVQNTGDASWGEKKCIAVLRPRQNVVKQQGALVQIFYSAIFNKIEHKQFNTMSGVQFARQ
jgi:hypothetical protein